MAIHQKLGSPAGHQVSETIRSLVWKSLVIATGADEESRYRLLETLRSYALDKLTESGEQREIRSRHCASFTALVEKAAPHLKKGDTGTWLTRLDQDLGNFRAALSWAIQSDNVELASRLVVGLWHYWLNYERALTLAGSVRALEDESGLNLLEGFSQQLEGLDEAREGIGSRQSSTPIRPRA